MPNAGVHRKPLSESLALQEALRTLGAAQGFLEGYAEGLLDDALSFGEPLRGFLQGVSRDLGKEVKKLDRAVKVLFTLQDQAIRGIHRNPPGLTFKGRGPFGTDVEEMRYRHTSDGKLYKHDFATGVEVHAVVRNGKKELLLSHESGLPLWDDFPD